MMRALGFSMSMMKTGAGPKLKIWRECQPKRRAQVKTFQQDSGLTAEGKTLGHWSTS